MEYLWNSVSENLDEEQAIALYHIISIPFIMLVLNEGYVILVFISF